MAHVTREHLDRLLEQGLLADDHAPLAEQLDALAASYVSGDVSRAAIFVLAGDEWRQAGQPARALASYQRAVEDGGEVGVDPRAGIADTLFELDRADEARQVIEDIRSEGSATPSTCLNLAETLAAYNDLRAAHEWATQGALAGAEGSGERTALLRVRYRIRVDLGLPEDELDALVS